jgi:hypothetical protein
MDTKYCWKCKEIKAIGEFARSGVDACCKPCRYALNTEWSQNHREELRPKRKEYMRAYRAQKKAQKDALEKMFPTEKKP